MLEKYEWISVDRKFFGEPGSAYDFKATDPNDAAKRIKKLEENKVCAHSHCGLGYRLNMFSLYSRIRVQFSSKNR